MPTMNWEKEANNNPVYPKGAYKVELVSFERTKASTGTPQIRWKTRIILPEAHAGRFLFDHTALTEKALWRIANLVDGFGIDLSKLGNMSTDTGMFDDVCRACVGRTSFWRNEEGVNNNTGQPKNNIVEFIRDPEQMPLALDGTTSPDAPDFVK